MRLHNPLGKWLLPAPAHWPCWYDITGHSVYLKEDGNWRKFQMMQQGLQLQLSFIRHTLHAALPPNTLHDIGWLLTARQHQPEQVGGLDRQQKDL